MSGSRFGADIAYFESLPLSKWWYLLGIHEKAVKEHNDRIEKSSKSKP
jgi:hypothetical protein